MPLIRYEIGDYATVGHACPGGRNLGSLSEIVGRTRNLLRHPDGRARWPEGLSRIARAGNIRDFSFVQTSLSKIEMQICAPIDSTSHEAVLGACKEILGPEFAYEVVVVDPSTLRRGSRRKQEEFRSLVAVA